MSDKPYKYHPAAFYVSVLPIIVETARAHGYAIGVHGSLGRDFDLIAAPWKEDCGSALDLILAIKEVTGTNTHHFQLDEWFPECAPTNKPYGRICYSLHFTNQGGDGAYLDISVMPKVVKPNYDNPY